MSTATSVASAEPATVWVSAGVVCGILTTNHRRVKELVDAGLIRKRVLPGKSRPRLALADALKLAREGGA
jgi:hypothetical protein